MYNIQFNDHPVCQVMADKAMYDPKYKLQLEKTASGKGRMNVAIEDDMTKIRHKIVMLNKLERKNHQHNREMRNAEFGRDPRCALISAVSLSCRLLASTMKKTNTATDRGELLPIRVEL